MQVISLSNNAVAQTIKSLVKIKDSIKKLLRNILLV
jgi:hypothetical protein